MLSGGWLECKQKIAYSHAKMYIILFYDIMLTRNTNSIPKINNMGVIK